MAHEISSLKQRIREASDAELRQMLNEFKQELFNLRFQKAQQQLANPKRIRFVRKAIARILTEMRARELGREREGTVVGGGKGT